MIYLKKIDKSEKQKILSIDGVASISLCKRGREPKAKIEIIKGYSKKDIPKRVDGYKTKIVEIEENDLDKPSIQTDVSLYTQKNRPLFPGCQISSGISGFGSIGFMVDYNGQLYVITVAHLLSGDWQGVEMYQPLKSYGDDGDNKIGEITHWVDIYKNSPDDVKPSDSMAIKLNNEIEVTNKPMEVDNFIPEDFIEPELDMEVYHFGRTTGMRKGKIVEVDVTVRLNDDPNWYCENLFRTDSISEPGDSGGCVMSIDPPAILGTHVGGSSRGTLSNDVLEIFKALDFDINKVKLVDEA